MARDLFTNQASTTVSAGGTTAPAAGTAESWTVLSSASFPAASNATNPASQFYVADPLLSSETILVTNVSGTTWSVIRGADGTTPVAHSAGFTVRNVVPATWLQSVDDKLKYTTLYVKDYGAKGDDSTDDSAAIQAALDDAFYQGGGQVVVTPGIYRHMSPPLHIRSNVRLTLLPGAEIHRYNDTGGCSMLWNGDTGQNRAGYTGHGNIIIEGGVWDLRCSTSTVALANDTFTRSNTSAPHTLGVMDSGQTWIDEVMRDDGTSTAGCLGITSNTVSAAAAGTNISTVKSWPNGTVSCTIPTAGNAGLVFRLADGQNYWQYVRHTDTNARLSYWKNGVETVVTPNATVSVSAGSTLKVVFFGNRIRAYVGSTLTHDTADLAGFTAKRKVGLVVFDTTARLDAFTSTASIWADTFTRANSSTSLGTASSNYPWTSQSGTLGISSNLAYAPTAGTNVSTVDVISETNPTVTMPTVGNAGLVFRYVDPSNYWYFVRHTDGNARLGKVVAGVDNLVVPLATTAVSAGNTLQVQVMGKQIRTYVGTTNVHDTVDAFNYQATKAGIIIKDTAARLSAFDTPMSWGTASSGGAFNLGHGHNITIRDMKVRDVSQNQHCTEINACRRVLFDNCTYEGTVPFNLRESEAIQLDLSKGAGYFDSFGPFDNTPCKDVVIRSCSFVQSYMPGTTAWVRAVGSHSGTVGTTTSHDSIRIVDNYMETTEKGIRGYGWNNSIIANNHFVGGWGLEVRPLWTGHTDDTLNRVGTQTSASQDIENLVISGNTFEGQITGGDAVIKVFGESTGTVHAPTITGNVIRNAPDYGIQLIDVDCGTVTGNVIIDGASRGIDLAAGANYNTISGNNIRRAGDRAIYVNSGAAYNQIANNYVKGARGTSGANAAISISGNSGNTGNVVSGNTIVKEGSGSEAAFAMKLEGANATGNSFLGNVCHGWGTTLASNVSISGTLTTTYVLSLSSGTGTAESNTYYST